MSNSKWNRNGTSPLIFVCLFGQNKTILFEGMKTIWLHKGHVILEWVSRIYFNYNFQLECFQKLGYVSEKSRCYPPSFFNHPVDAQLSRYLSYCNTKEVEKTGMEEYRFSYFTFAHWSVITPCCKNFRYPLAGNAFCPL